MANAQSLSNKIENESGKYSEDARVNNWLATNYVVEVRNAFANYENIRQLREAGRAYPMQEFQKKNKGRAMVIGSGSSLDLYIDKLKKWPGKIFCSTSQASTLIKYGRHPDHLCLIDPNTAPPESPEYEIPDNDWKDTILTTHPSGPWRDIKHWKENTPNDVYLFRLHDNRLEWYRSTLYYSYPWVKSIVVPFLDSTAAQIAIAAYLGYDPLYLLGVDYGGPRFRRSFYRNGEWITDPESRYEKGTLNYYDAITPQGVGTSPAYLFTKRGPCMCIVMHLYHGFFKRIYNLAPHDRSCMVEVPHADFNKILKTKKDPPIDGYNAQKVYDDLSIYLAWTNTFAVPIHNGLGASLAKYAVRNIEELRGVLHNLNQDLARSKAYYLGMIERSGKSLKEIAETGAVPDEGQRTAMAHIDLDKMKSVDIEAFMERAAALKAIGDRRYGQGIKIRKKPEPYNVAYKKRTMDDSEDDYLNVMKVSKDEVEDSLKDISDRIVKQESKKKILGMQKENAQAYLEDMKTGPQGLPEATEAEEKHVKEKHRRITNEYLEQMKIGSSLDMGEDSPLDRK